MFKCNVVVSYINFAQDNIRLVSIQTHLFTIRSYHNLILNLMILHYSFRGLQTRIYTPYASTKFYHCRLRLLKLRVYDKPCKTRILMLLLSLIQHDISVRCLFVSEEYVIIHVSLKHHFINILQIFSRALTKTNQELEFGINGPVLVTFLKGYAGVFKFFSRLNIWILLCIPTAYVLTISQ